MSIFDKNTVKLLRIPFSFFLMPVYFLSISEAVKSSSFSITNAILIFFILHLFIYPASNGYNSYMDQDEGSIGGLKNPPKATKSLFYAALLFDSIGLILSFWIGVEFFVGILLYIIVSRAYSWKGVRLKKFPIIGFASVVVFQGAITLFNVFIGSTSVPIEMVLEKLYFPALASTFMIGGVYPLTQIYQHQEDYENGDITISLLLGYKGTFVFSIIMFFCAGICLFVHFEAIEFLIFQVFLAPVAFFFVKWMLQVWKDASNANFENTMKMNTIASICMNLCFIFLAIKTILHF